MTRYAQTAVMWFAISTGGAAAGPSCALQCQWLAPLTNDDGTPLTDLSHYLLAYRSPWRVWAYKQVPAKSAAPCVSTVESFVLGGLKRGKRYRICVYAVDKQGKVSKRSNIVEGVPR